MFYSTVNTSKQAIHQLIDRRLTTNEQNGYLEKLIREIRADHPTLSCRAIYYKLAPEGIGRDKFEALCNELGLLSGKKRSSYRTTNSTGVIRFDDYLTGLQLTQINQAFSSDITYFEVTGKFYFITFILDCFSRKIVGHSTSKRLTTEQTTLPALHLALKNRGYALPENMIFHSDGGGQYYDKEFLAFTKHYKMKNSMCEYAYENGKAERLNGIIKNNYLIHYKINSYEELVKNVDRSVCLYNNDRPHSKLKYKTPSQFEKDFVNLQTQTKPTMKESLMAN